MTATLATCFLNIYSWSGAQALRTWRSVLAGGGERYASLAARDAKWSPLWIGNPHRHVVGSSRTIPELSAVVTAPAISSTAHGNAAGV